METSGNDTKLPPGLLTKTLGADVYLRDEVQSITTPK